VDATLEAGLFDGAITSSVLTVPNAVLLGVDNGKNPLLTVVATLSSKSIEQSFPLVSASNTITVTITPSVNFVEGSTITLSGLTGTQTEDAGALAVTSSPIKFESTGGWSKTSGTLVLTVASGGFLSATTDYTVSFVVQNGDDAQAAAVTVAFEANLDPSGVSYLFASVNLEPATGDLLGVTSGASPMLLVVPTFTVKSIEQSSPLNGVKNTLTITLTSDVNLPATSTVTILGLTGTQTVTSGTQTITSSPSRYGTQASWDIDGTLILTVGGTAATAGVDVVVTIELDNKATAQVAVAPTVRPVSGGQSTLECNGVFWRVACSRAL
jgi:hypothetical protein